jgi:hypothetical protein
VCEIDNPHHPESEAQSDRQDAVDAANENSAEDCLQRQKQDSVDPGHGQSTGAVASLRPTDRFRSNSTIAPSHQTCAVVTDSLAGSVRISAP